MVLVPCVLYRPSKSNKHNNEIIFVIFVIIIIVVVMVIIIGIVVTIVIMIINIIIINERTYIRSSSHYYLLKNRLFNIHRRCRHDLKVTEFLMELKTKSEIYSHFLRRIERVVNVAWRKILIKDRTG